MSGDKCPVCGQELASPKPACGFGDKCTHAPLLAIERAAEIERLKAELAKHSELWHTAQKWSDWFESQRDELADQVANLREENARLKAQLKTMADFFAHYTCLSECGQEEVEDEAERLIASARNALTETKPEQENQ